MQDKVNHFAISFVLFMGKFLEIAGWDEEMGFCLSSFLCTSTNNNQRREAKSWALHGNALPLPQATLSQLPLPQNCPALAKLPALALCPLGWRGCALWHVRKSTRPMQVTCIC